MYIIWSLCMRSLSVKQVRANLSALIREAEAGDCVLITRYGKPIAQITPIEKERPRFPDLSAFRASIKPRGKSLTEALRQIRAEERA